MAPRVDLTGETFGRLTVVELTDSRDGKPRWKCRCECGANHEVSVSNLRSGGVRSCGCLSRELSSARMTRHGLYDNLLFRAWKSMHSRCGNPHNDGWKYYGARGITVCERWQAFENFDDDMGSSFKPGLSLERKDTNGNYEPGNCEWIPLSEQSRNRRPPQVWTFKSTPTSASKTGVRGAYWSPRHNKWRARIVINKQEVHLGTFATKEEAGEAYRLAAERRRLDGNKGSAS